MKDRPKRKTDNMLIGRISIPEARYFITVCTQNKTIDLLQNPTISESILTAWRQLHTDKDIHFYCGTTMPDHIHFLFKLGTRLELSQVLIKFKKLTKQALNKSTLTWQRNYYDHRLRVDTALEGFAKYIFLNPYRKGLVTADQVFPHWHINKTYRPAFTEHLIQSKFPQPKWLNQNKSITTLIEDDMLSNDAAGS